jgi:hypothetical protein
MRKRDLSLLAAALVALTASVSAAKLIQDAAIAEEVTPDAPAHSWYDDLPATYEAHWETCRDLVATYDLAAAEAQAMRIDCIIDLERLALNGIWAIERINPDLAVACRDGDGRLRETPWHHLQCLEAELAPYGMMLSTLERLSAAARLKATRR